MRNYQTLSLIGCIFGILITMAWGATFGAVINISENLGTDTSQFEQEMGGWIVGLFFAFIIYIVLLVLTFTMKTTKKVKILGIILLAGGVINTAITNLWGIVALALLIPAGVIALRYKPSTSKRYRLVEEEGEGGEK
jgi:drug/metabolite transporter (DMT)-like permease